MLSSLSMHRLAGINTAVPAGNTVANTTAETAFATQHAFAAGALRVGSLLRLSMRGVYSSTALAPTIHARLKIGATTLLTSGALAVLANLASNLPWSALVDMTIGSGGIEAAGTLLFATGLTGVVSVPLGNTAPVFVDLSQPQSLITTVQWGGLGGANSITLRQSIAELMRG